MSFQSHAKLAEHLTDADNLVLKQALRYTYELALVYFGAVVLGLVATAAAPYAYGLLPLRMMIPQIGIYIAFGIANLVMAEGIQGRKRWALIGALASAGLSALYFFAASLFDLLLLPFTLPHLILSGIFMTLVIPAGIRSGQGIAALSRAASLAATGFEAIVPTARVIDSTSDAGRGIAA